MTDKQYDVSDEMLRLFKIKQKQRAEAKAYFQRIITNPHRPPGEGMPFDPVLFRFNALGPYQIEHFKPTPRNFIYLLAYSILPVYVIFKTATWENSRREKQIKSGLLPYKDRLFKLVF